MKGMKTLLVSALTLLMGVSAWADNMNNNLVYNAKEVDGLKVAETIYKNEDNLLQKYMQYNYKYDEQKRLTESEALKWDGKVWKKDMCIRYSYSGNSVTTTYYQWNEGQGTYVLMPDMTVTMENPNL